MIYLQCHFHSPVCLSDCVGDSLCLLSTKPGVSLSDCRGVHRLDRERNGHFAQTGLSPNSRGPGLFRRHAVLLSGLFFFRLLDSRQISPAISELAERGNNTSSAYSPRLLLSNSCFSEGKQTDTRTLARTTGLQLCDGDWYFPQTGSAASQCLKLLIRCCISESLHFDLNAGAELPELLIYCPCALGTGWKNGLYSSEFVVHIE